MEHLNRRAGRRVSRGPSILGVLAAVLCTSWVACGCGSDAALSQVEANHPWILNPSKATSFRFFSPQSFWNTPLTHQAPLDTSSTPLVDTFAKEIGRELEAGNGPWINTTDYSVPIYTVPKSQPTVRVRLSSAFSAPALQSAWRDVPLPPHARPAEGSDRSLVIWQPHSDRLWEFWRLRRTPAGWEAAWGGAIRKASSNAGVYGPAAWPGARRSWGASASSFSIAGGLVTFDDLRRGWINHALALAVPSPRAGVFASPAQRTDGTSESPESLPEGAHLRLDPSLNLAELHLPRLTLMIAKASQRFGIFVRDKAEVAHFFAQDPGPAGTNPYLGADGYFEGTSPARLLASFPWSHLQVMAMDLHGFSPRSPRGSD